MSWKQIIEKIKNDFGLSFYEIDKLTGVSNVTLYRLSKGQTLKVNASTKRDLEKGLNITINDTDPNNVTYTKNEKVNIEIKNSQASGNTNSKVHYVNNSPTFTPPALDMGTTKTVMELEFEIKKRDTLIKMYDEELKKLNTKIIELELENSRLNNIKKE